MSSTTEPPGGTAPGGTTSGGAARYRDVFAVPEFRALFALQTLLVLGDNVKTLALSVLVYERTDSPLLAAVAFMAGMLPYALGGALLLSLADRMRSRVLLAGFHTMRAAVTGLLAVGAVPIPVAIALVALTGLFAPVGGAVASGTISDLLHGDRYVLGRSLFVMTAAGAQIGGNGLGGALLPAMGPHGVLWLATASCVLAAVVAWAGVGDRPARRTGPAAGSAVRATWLVNRRLLGDPAVRGLLLAQWLPISLAVGAEAVMVPYAAALGHPEAAGTMLAAAAAGMFTGNVVFGRFVSPARRERFALPLALLPGAPFLLFVVKPGLVVAIALTAAAACGLAYELGLQRRYLVAAGTDVRGQALGLASTGVMTGQAMGMAVAGGVAELLPPGSVMALCGAASMASALLLAGRLRPGPEERERPGAAC